MSKLNNRLTQLEKQNPPRGMDVSLLKPSEILARVDELLETARTRKAEDAPRLSVWTKAEAEDVARRIDSLRQWVKHAKP
ncbi:MAG: hypothetical protein ABI904_00875 [Chloroflexota bacterium]